MKVIVLCENLQRKLTFINRAVSSKSQLPVLLNILIKARNGKLTLSSTDLEIGIQTEVPVNIEEEGATTVPAKTFSELISTLPSGKVTLLTNNKALEVKTPKTNNIFQTIPEEEFPNLYEEKGEEAAIVKKETFQKDFSQVIFAASNDLARPALSGIFIEKTKKGFLLVATDGYRLSLKKETLLSDKARKTSTKKSLLVPARVLREVMAIKEGDEDVVVYVGKTNNQVLFQNDNTILVGRLIEGEFPAYEKIIPTGHTTQFVFDKEELQKAVKICAIFARDAANIVKFVIKKEGLIVSANTPSVGENTAEVEGKLIGDENEIAFNARYLLDLFANSEETEMVFEMTTPLSPGVFKIKDDPSFLHLIMPIRVQG